MTWETNLSICNVICAVDDIECNVSLKNVCVYKIIFVLSIGLFLLDFSNLCFIFGFAYLDVINLY